VPTSPTDSSLALSFALASLAQVVCSYFGDAKRRGFEKVHIWSCPPTRGNNFIFWGHPASQKTPNRIRLQSWYQSLVARAIEVGICTNVTSLYEEAFEDVGGATAFVADKLPKSPSILAGDFWIDEVNRISKQQLKRSVRAKRREIEATPLSNPSCADQGWRRRRRAPRQVVLGC
jgi:E1A/CREB-binding protein